jgi:hypothetical protein
MNAKVKFGWLVIALFFVGCATNAEQVGSSASSGNRQSASLPAPPGWVQYPAPAADSSALRCANFSQREWKVSLKNDEVKISPFSEGHTEESLPFKIQPKNAAGGLAGDRHVKRVSDGWLVGFDAGEFGGALWWFSIDGLKRKKLADENVVGFADSSLGVLVLVGLAHMGSDRGRVLQVKEGDEGQRQVSVLADLKGAPRAFAKEASNSMLVLTTNRFVRVLTTGKVEELLSTNYGSLYPNSMTLSKTGMIHIGMRHFITRLTPINGSYKEEWFVPVDCQRFRMREYDCLCLRR